MLMSARGQRFTARWKTPQYYSDFLDDFSTNPTTGALAVLSNEDAINQSIQNLIYTVPGERRGRNSIGSKVMSSMFDLGTPASLETLKATIISVIENHEPRVDSVTVDVDPTGLQNNYVTVTITYRPINLPQTVTLAFDLKRIR